MDPPDEPEGDDEARDPDDLDHTSDWEISEWEVEPADADFGSLDEFVFDEEFVRAAEVVEPTADERQRAFRQANLQRLLRDREAHEDRLGEHRRFAPSSDPDNFHAGHGSHGSGFPSHDDWDDTDWLSDLDAEDNELWLSLRRRRRNRRVLTAVSVIVVISVVFVYALSQFFAGVSLRSLNSGNGSGSQTQPNAKPGTRAPGDPIDATAGSTSRPDGWPPLGKWALTPLGVPAAVPAGGGPHQFLMTQSDGATPVAYDPCRVIHYVTSGLSEAPGGSDRLVRDAVKTVSELTGLVFVDDGATDEAPSDDRAAYQPDRYGEHWAPVLISWSTAARSPRLGVTTPEGAPAGTTVDVLGYAGSVSAGFTTEGASVKPAEPKGLMARGPGVSITGPPAGDETQSKSQTSDGGISKNRIYVTGSLVLDSQNFADMLSQFDGYARARATVLHELGHLVGLNHVDAADQLMAPTLHGSVTEFAAGDREGLAALGKGACVPEI